MKALYDLIPPVLPGHPDDPSEGEIYYNYTDKKIYFYNDTDDVWVGVGDGSNTILNGTGAPSGGTGVDGDFYIDTTAWQVYGPKTSGSWPSGVNMEGTDGIDGIDGTNGTNGYSVLNGSGAPGGGTGVDGDFYIQTSNWTIYGPKASGSWGSPTNLIGANGTNGTNAPVQIPFGFYNSNTTLGYLVTQNMTLTNKVTNGTGSIDIKDAGVSITTWPHTVTASAGSPVLITATSTGVSGNYYVTIYGTF